MRAILRLLDSYFGAVGAVDSGDELLPDAALGKGRGGGIAPVAPASHGEVRSAAGRERAGPLATATGLVLTPDLAFAECPQLDILCVPGGIGVNPLMEDEEVLAAAGLLAGRRATTHWASHDFLARLGVVPVRAREVAEAVQLNLEYAPEPPFTSGQPETAPAEVVAIVRERVSLSRAG